MMKQKRAAAVFFAAALALTSAAPALSESLEALVGAELAAELANGAVIEVQLKAPRLKLIPRHAELRHLAGNIQQELEPAILAESLQRYEKPAGAHKEAWSGTERSSLYNEILALSSLTGVQYYSASRKTMRIFYEYSRIIDSPETKRVLEDPRYAEPPAEQILYARQKDLSFGDNIYKYEYHAGSDFFMFVQQNLTAMNYGIIPAVGKNKLRSLAAVIDAGDYLLIYAASMAKTAALPGLGERIGNSFSSRVEAILKWFSGRADAAFAKAGT
jgi:hypothetical protein